MFSLCLTVHRGRAGGGGTLLTGLWSLVSGLWSQVPSQEGGYPSLWTQVSSGEGVPLSLSWLGEVPGLGGSKVIILNSRSDTKPNIPMSNY